MSTIATGMSVRLDSPAASTPCLTLRPSNEIRLNEVPMWVLVGALIILIFLSAFFSSAETGMMSLNRYRLRNLARKHRGARRAHKLLERPDRLIGVILLGNNFVNILASSIATIIALRLFGQAGIAIATFLLTLLILIFAELAPKTLATLYPERVAFPAALILNILLKIFRPVVVVANILANGLLRMFGVSTDTTQSQQLTGDEIRIVLNEAGSMLSQRYKRMLMSILDLERVTVNDIMVPRGEIHVIDLEDELDEIRDQLIHSQYTRLPICRGDFNNVIGILHVRRLLLALSRNKLDMERLVKACDAPYFIPESTSLDVQLRNFQREQERLGLVVDEYGDVQGLVVLNDLLEEIVGEFTSDPADLATDVHPQDDGTYLVDGSTNIRALNRAYHFELPTQGPKTINGLVIEYLESIPETGTSILIANYPIEVVQTTDNAIKTLRISPRLKNRQKK